MKRKQMYLVLVDFICTRSVEVEASSRVEASAIALRLCEAARIVAGVEKDIAALKVHTPTCLGAVKKPKFKRAKDV